MNIDRIISESIERLVDEARLIDPNEYMANQYGGTFKEKRRKYNTQPRRRVTSLYDATTTNQVGKLLRSAWDCKQLEAIGGFARNYYVFGRAASDALFNFYRDEKGDMFVQFNTMLNNIKKLTTDIENWAKTGDKKSVISRLRDLPTPLEELALLIGNLTNKTKKLLRYRPFLDLRGDAARKGNILDGYKTVNGLMDLVIASRNPQGVDAVTQKLRECAEYIRDKWGDNNIKNSGQQVVSMDDNDY